MSNYSETNDSNLNRIFKGTKIVGTIESSSDIRIEGDVEGSVVSNGKIIVGETGNIKGDLTCKSAEIAGVLNGKINAKETLTLKANSKTTSDVSIQKLVVENGAIFNGTIKMGQSVGNGFATPASASTMPKQENKYDKK